MTNRVDPGGAVTEGNARSLPVSPWAFGPSDKEIRVGNAELLLAQLPIFLGGWPCRRLDDEDRADMDISIVERPDKKIEVKLTGPGALDSVFEDEFGAADGLANALIAAFISRHADTLCLHASSVQLGPGLVVLLGDSLAGKSSVALQLSAAGYRLFGDDRLAVRPGEGGVFSGICLGLTPKVRLPLPADCGRRFAEYVESFTEIRDDTVAYLKLWEGEAAVFQEHSPIEAFVILNRAESGSCTLSPASRPAIVRALLAQCFAPHIAAQDLVPVLTDMASGVAGYELGFSHSGEAASLLTATLRGVSLT
jgi:hypothetical protein